MLHVKFLSFDDAGCSIVINNNETDLVRKEIISELRDFKIAIIKNRDECWFIKVRNNLKIESRVEHV